MKKRLPALNCLTGLLGVLLLVAAEDSLAVMVMLEPTVKRNAVSTGGIFVLDPNNSNVLSTQQILSSDPNVPSVDKRSILEFPLSTIPANSTIISAILNLNNNINNMAVIPVYGYEGNGTAEIVDVTVTADQLGKSDPIEELGISFPLDVDFISELLDNSATHLGMLLLGDASGKEVTFGGTFVEPAVLNLSFEIPGDFDLDGDVDGFDFLLWQRGGSPDPLSADDLSDWENNYGTTTTLAAITSVPEPTTLCFVLLGALRLLVKRFPTR